MQAKIEHASAANQRESGWTSPISRREALVRMGAAGAGAAGLARAAGGTRRAAAQSEPVTIRVATWTAYAEKALTGAFAQFEEENPGIKVELEIRPGASYWDKLQIEFAGGTVPDISLNQIGWVVPGAARGMFLDLKPNMVRDNIDLNAYIFPHELEWGWRDGIYAGFWGIVSGATFINKELLAAAGLEFPAADWTWDDLVEYARQLTKPDDNQWGLMIPYLMPPYEGTSFIHGAGGTVLNDTYDKCTLTEPGARAGLQFLADLIFKEKVMPAPAVFEGQDDPFLTGKVAILHGPTTTLRDLKEPPPFDWDVAPMPVNAQTGIRSVQVGSNAWSIFSTTDHPEEAWQVLRFLMGDVAARAQMDYIFPAERVLAEGPDYQERFPGRNIKAIVDDVMNYGHDYYPTPDAYEWWAVAEQELSLIFSGEATVEEATERACTAVDEVFSRRPADWM